MALLAMVTVVAPIAGPDPRRLDHRQLLAGHGSSSSTCRSGIFCRFVVGRQLKGRPERLEKPKMDYVGLITLVLGVGALQIMLDLGNDEDWFGSNQIVALAIVAAIALAVFVIWELTDKDPIVNLRLFRHRNFASGHRWRWWWRTAAFFSVGLLVPLWLQRNLGLHGDLGGLRHGADRHPAGDADAVRGQVRARSSTCACWRPSRSSCMALTSFMRAGFNLDVDFEHIAMVQLLQGIGVALFFMPVLHDPAVGPAAARDRGRLGPGDVHAHAGRQLRRVADDVGVDRTQHGAPRAPHRKHLSAYDPATHRSGHAPGQRRPATWCGGA